MIFSVPAGIDAPSISLQLMLTLATMAAVGVPEMMPVIVFNVTFAGNAPEASA